MVAINLQKQQLAESITFSPDVNMIRTVGIAADSCYPPIKEELSEALKAPDGSSFWYSIRCRARKHEIRGSKLTRVFQAALSDQQKEYLPAIFCRTNKSYTILVADFDNMRLIKASRFKSCVDSWSDFEERVLRPLLPQESLILTSPSGKRKAIILAEGHLTTEQIKITLEAILGNDLYSLCDTSHRALNKLFITKNMFSSISEYINSGLYMYRENIESILKNKDKSEIKENKEREGNNWKDYKYQVPQIVKNQTALKLVKFMAGNPWLALTRIGLNQQWLAKRYNSTQYDISKAISHLVLKGYLEKVSNYFVGKKCNEYKVSGLLREWMETVLFKETGRRLLNKESVELPTAIEDGCWTDTLWSNVKYFNNQDEWIEYISTIEGINKKDRLKQAKSIGRFVFKGEIER